MSSATGTPSLGMIPGGIPYLGTLVFITAEDLDQIQFPGFNATGVGVFSSAGVPVNGTSGTGAGNAGKGSLCVDTTNGDLYINQNTTASPTWAKFSSTGETGSFTTLTAAAFNYGTDAGAADAYTVTTPALSALAAGNLVFFKVGAGNTNTGASTLAVNGLTAKNIYFQGVPLQAGMLVAGQEYAVIYDGTQFELLGGFTTRPNAVDPAYIADSSAVADTITVAPAPALTSYVAGQKLIVKVANTNTGATNLNANALGNKAVQAAGAALVAGQLVAGLVYEFVYDGTQFQVESPNPALASADIFVGNASGLAAAVAMSGDATISNTGAVTVVAAHTTGVIQYAAPVANGNSGTAFTVNFSKQVQQVTLTGNCTFTFTAPPGPARLLLELTQDATGSRTVTWPAAVKWSGGTAPTLTTTAAHVDLILLEYDGTNYIGSSILDYH